MYAFSKENGLERVCGAKPTWHPSQTSMIFYNKNFLYDRKAREDLDAKNQKLAEMEADYGDVVPRRDFERLEAQFNVRNRLFLCYL